jgi:hypothetical protein
VLVVRAGKINQLVSSVSKNENPITKSNQNIVSKIMTGKNNK